MANQPEVNKIGQINLKYKKKNPRPNYNPLCAGDPCGRPPGLAQSPLQMRRGGRLCPPAVRSPLSYTWFYNFTPLHRQTKSRRYIQSAALSSKYIQICIKLPRSRQALPPRSRLARHSAPSPSSGGVCAAPGESSATGSAPSRSPPAWALFRRSGCPFSGSPA